MKVSPTDSSTPKTMQPVSFYINAKETVQNHYFAPSTGFRSELALNTKLPLSVIDTRMVLPLLMSLIFSQLMKLNVLSALLRLAFLGKNATGLKDMADDLFLSLLPLSGILCPNLFEALPLSHLSNLASILTSSENTSADSSCSFDAS